METLAKPQEFQNPCLISSPDSHSSNSSSCSNSSNTNVLHHHQHHHHRYPTPPTTPTPTTPPPQQQLPITRSEPNNPYPTTFVQADASSFKQVVQMLTGSSEPAKPAGSPNSGRAEPVRNPIPPIKTGTKKEKTSSKLYERRNSMKNFKISPLGPGVVNNKSIFSGGFSGSPRTATPEILSPSILDFPALALSPVTPLIPDPFNRSPEKLDLEAEEKAIAKKGFFLHPSPASTPRESEPRLLPLFPVTSPRVSVWEFT
ncbi:VQ motif-containing protein 4-like isoform X2 [Lycium barbarum]|uniref:VQ motif-containing protein 4-like isoform X2 n=1 Tax=Lycium barbarum TaxID=112863 RepID=UPI00293E83EE|nr:VQ motif-containing protein 4-like isoform X2 [Lycium barbarum]